MYMNDDEKEGIARQGKFYRPRGLKKVELNHNVDDIMSEVDEKKDKRDTSGYEFWYH